MNRYLMLSIDDHGQPVEAVVIQGDDDNAKNAAEFEWSVSIGVRQVMVYRLDSWEMRGLANTWVHTAGYPI